MRDLEKKFKLAQEFLSVPHLQMFCDEGLVDKRIVRNCRIIKDFVSLRKKHDFLDTINMLSEKYLISIERIQSILYKRKL